MDTLVEDVLQNAAEKHSRYKTTVVTKDIEVDIDEGHLLATDTNPLNLKDLRSQKDDYLKDLARDNVQLLINRLWELPVKRVDDVVVAELPAPKTVLPREKPIPKATPATKWQAYAKLKSINKRKETRKVWDEASQEYKPRWGYKRGGDDTKDWMIEVPVNADPYEDQYEKRKKAKTERVAKNELQRLRNIARNMKGKVPGVGLTPTENPDKDHLSRALHLAKRSTASMGKFTKVLPKEKPAKHVGKKRKFESSVGNMKDEKKRTLDIASKLISNRPTLDVQKAANQEIHHQERQRSENKSDSKGKGKAKGKGKGKGQSGKGGKKFTGKAKGKGKGGPSTTRKNPKR